MQKKVTVTIGIPAYNEEQNIAQLLSDLLKQKTYDCVIEKILVVSDGSRDKTVPVVSRVQSEKIQLVSFVTRKGLAFVQNEIINRVTSDILIILNADIRIADTQFVERLTDPIRKGSADLTSCTIVAITPRTFFEQVLAVSMMIKDRVFTTYRNGDNVYTCHGPARAFGKSLYKHLEFENSIGEDAYSYLYAVSQGYSYQYVKTTSLFYKLPDVFADHMKQSLRFIESRKQYIERFGEAFVMESYAIPTGLLIKSVLQTTLTHPVLSISYFAVLTYTTIKSSFSKSGPDLWTMSKSSKTLSIQK